MQVEYGQWVVGQSVGGRWYGGRMVGTRLAGHPDHGTLIEIDINPNPRYTYCVGVRLDTVEKVDGYEATWAPCHNSDRTRVFHALSFNGYGVSECGRQIGFQARETRSRLARHLPEHAEMCQECLVALEDAAQLR